MGALSAQRARDDIVRLAHRGLGVDEFSRAGARAIRRQVPHDGVCVLTMDPATMLPTGEVIENGLPPDATRRLAQIEIGEPDVNKFAELARRRVPAAGLGEATGGSLDRSLRHRELRRPEGMGDELRAVLADETGSWGAITLMREASSPRFSPGDVALVASVSGHLAEGVRRAMLHTRVAGNEAAEGSVGMVVLGPENEIASASGPAAAWLEELGAPGRVPPVIAAVAGMARLAADEADPGEELSLARARVRLPSGPWLLVRGSLIGEGDGARAVLVLEPARAAELAPLIADAYGLTRREREVTQLVAQGLGTDAIASRLHLSPWTVQDHLKAIFEKTGTGSRGELVGHLFFEHYAPRLTDAPGT